ncbi:hypothetical protein [Shewanella colwelliana]|uniref:hypothetical protein n=1 Tax=Shewanella colwelliana TaxID=23 RepID=UPI0022AF2763|nr:hypothetical protein [Shewanella colwelliana]MCZ4336157.1 hypothetical protein [Shewanella colwelliana]
MSNAIVVTSQSQVVTGVDQFSNGLSTYLTELGLPSSNVLVPVTERSRVINNLPEVINLVDSSQRTTSIYLSKFIAACGAGLFDAALNFIWDETVVNLRKKVVKFDLEYFYDSVVTDENRRNKLKDEEDLVKLDEWELVRGCHLTGILSDIGYKHLDYIRDMRNWASAAHPNQNDLTGFQLISWLETCIREVIGKEPEGPAIEIKRFLGSIRNNVLTASDAMHINAGIEHLPSDLGTSLLRTLFGMYTGNGVNAQLKNNIKLVCSTAWNISPDEVKYECGFKYATFASNGEIERRDSAREFLTVVNGLPFLPSDTLAVELSEKITNLYNAHIGFNNFHNEPSHARILDSYVSSTGAVPDSVRKAYVKTIVMSKIGNGHGVSSMAASYYDNMLQKFGESEIKEFASLVMDREFSSRIALSSCRNNYKALANYFLPRTTNQITIQAIQSINQATDQQLPNLGKDSRYQQLIASYAQ